MQVIKTQAKMLFMVCNLGVKIASFYINLSTNKGIGWLLKR